MGGAELSGPAAAGDPHFSDISTRWSELKGPPREALDYLCRTYGAAVLNYLQGRLARGDFSPLGTQDRDDLFQDFFVRLGTTEWLKKPDPARGAFRPYFRRRLDLFLRERRCAALERLGRGQKGDIDSVPEPATADLMEEQLEKEWKRATVLAALERIRRDHPTWADALSAYLESPDAAEDEIAGRLGKSLDSYRSLLKRGKRAFREVYPLIERRLDGFGGEVLS
jgi:DNA-directed RNA polymerase specialized sigma24 family protein